MRVFGVPLISFGALLKRLNRGLNGAIGLRVDRALYHGVVRVDILRVLVRHFLIFRVVFNKAFCEFKAISLIAIKK